MEKDHAFKVLSGACTDYCGMLEKEGHHTAAKLMAANCNLALGALTGDNSSRPPGTGTENAKNQN